MSLSPEPKSDRDPLGLTREIIRRDGLNDWLADFPWLTGAIGDPLASAWFLAENPSLKGVREAHASTASPSPNLQWTCAEGSASRLLRDAICEAGLKALGPCVDAAWSCYITNADKEPQPVEKRNRGKGRGFMEQQATRWLPVLQAQIDRGDPKVLVCLGAQAERLLGLMRAKGLEAPPSRKVHHYSYVWFRPESKTGRGPRHPDRVQEFKEAIRRIADDFGSVR